MKKRYLVTLLTLLVIALAGVAQAWQGRMGGMGDPYGLISDESDFLIHPAKIAKGEGVRFYGGYRFTYTGVMDWDYDLDRFDTTGTVLTNFYNLDGSGQEYKHNTLLGAAFPLGPGRMGILFAYAGKRGDYDGDEDTLAAASFAAYDLRSELDDFALRLLYGLPIGSFKLGGEAQFAYRMDENRTWLNLSDLTIGAANLPWAGRLQFPFDVNLFPFMLPYDSHYWETLLKGSLEGEIGPLDLEFTLRGGGIISGDNKYVYEFESPVGALVSGIDMDGDVQGWRIGGDLWVRYPIMDNLALPFLVRVDYQTKTRDGDGAGFGGLTGFPYSYENQERNLQLEAGGGVDLKVGNGTKIAAGLYYDYLQGENDFSIWGNEAGAVFTYDYSDYPSHSENQIVVRLAGEHEFSPVFAMRMGLGFFYGWVGEDFTFTRSDNTPPGDNYTDDISLDGDRWGIGASLGGTLKIKPITLEPFVNGGYQVLNLNCNGQRTQLTGVISDQWTLTKDRSEWYIGGGVSVLFDLL
jgi:hypothetical protein